MMTFRILLFSILSAWALYVPFYHYAPIYHQMYEHVPIKNINWWIQWSFQEDNGGTQLYIAYVLMYVAIGLTASLEFIYVRFVSPRLHWIVLGLGTIACLFYLRTIGFYPPMADVQINEKGIFFITLATSAVFIFGRFFDHKFVKGLLLFLLFMVCMVSVLWSYWRVDYYYMLAPALRTIKGHALNQSYFQYDHLISLLAMAWMKLGLMPEKFLNVIDFTYFIFFVGVYFLAKNLFFDKRLAFYFIFTLVLIRIYCDPSATVEYPQVSPLRLDLWLLVLGLAFWKGPQHWTVGMAMGFLLVFHHAFGMIYSISYLLLVFFILVLNFSKNALKQYIPNACMMLGGELINQFFISANSSMPALNYLKYNIGFMPIGAKSFFWYVPVLISTTTLLLWKTRTQLKGFPQRYFQMGLFLVLLTIGNLLYFFGRSHEHNLINDSDCLWLVFFMFMDLIVYRLPQTYASVTKRVFIPLAGVLIVGALAYFYSGNAVNNIKWQAINLSHIQNLFKPNQEVKLDFKTLKGITRGNPDIIFMSLNHDFEYYYYGGYTPPEICPFVTQFFLLDLMDTLNRKLSKGADIIVPLNEVSQFQENILTLDAKYSYTISDFFYISNNKPDMGAVVK